MTFANGLARSVALTALALGSLGVVNAQNGTNYHVLNNGGDNAFGGIGAGGTQTAADGIGVYIPGEDCRGSLKLDPDGANPLLPQFTYRNAAWREISCLFGAGLSGFTQIRWPAMYFIELNGLNSNKNFVLTPPKCTSPIGSVVPYGVGPGTSGFSFVALAVSAIGSIGPQTIVVPDNGLVLGTGTATLVAAAGPIQIPSGTGSLASGYCYTVQFTWLPSAVKYLDNIDAIYHYAVTSDDLNQYWDMSDDEMNLWQSQTILSDAGATAIPTLFSVFDYAFVWASVEANTTAILAPNGIEQTGPYYAQTENMSGGGGPAGGPNFGFDVGRGSHAISFSGLGGVKVPVFLGGAGNGAQDPAYGGLPLNVKTLGFATWDNKANIGVGGNGSARMTWLAVDTPQIGGLPPESDPDITKAAGTVKIPIIGAGFLHPVTSLALPLFQHTTKAATSGWPDPNGFSMSGAFAVPAIAGGSLQFNVGTSVGLVACNVAFPINLTYGTSGKDHTPPPTFTWDPNNADISGSKEVYLWK